MQHHVVIKLVNGGELELDLTDKFLDKVCEFFELSDHQDITQDHLKKFIWDVATNALNEIES